MSRPKVAVIGLDCLEPSLAFDKFADHLPHLRELMSRGRWGRLTSTIPPITVPAWMCMATGQDPGQLGIYGFRNRREPSYGPPATAAAEWVDAPRLWDAASGAGLTSVVLGWPLTFPAAPLKGAMVSGPLTPPGAEGGVWPPSLAPRLNRWAGGEYLYDVKNFRTAPRKELYAQLELMARRRFAVAQGLHRLYAPDLFMMVEMSSDRLQHAFWEQPELMAQHYRLLDSLVGDLLTALAPDTLVLVVSDHGARPLEGGLAVNQWLRQRGYLTLKQPPIEPAPLTPEMVDWPNTRVWADGGYYGRIYLNLAGREPQGAVPPEEAPALLERLSAELTAMAGPDGRPLGNRVFRPQEIYRDTKGLPPELILYPGDLAWRALATVWPSDDPVFTEGNDSGPDGANHAQEGVLIAAPAAHGRLALAGQEVHGARLYDVFPSLCARLGLPQGEPGPGVAWEWLK
ncbi:MAG: alkaline phosphatase family protein [Desulfarculaceae bacterium]|nr:alkaline phosphatase family protein [Desulfarculaceae bacterium]MCF8047227.1 alkaline phosphatase family protein [Desulfarculaceae bacterium]MCF8064707.1 alkaline phosphatase family protein [Desulfarculaceae bacterium]MCF8097638.1 alkaline phosphatase family protein [Desulfarculaceae bacterium]MCF8122832.1 alkaline phosphatase family protein [Desulfarculaceae bacterium]